MTENEAIQALKLEGGIEITGNGKRVADFIAGLEIAISALKEIQKYREIGSVEEFRKLKERGAAIMSDLYKFGYTLDETIKTMRDVIDTGNHDRMFLDTYYWLKMLSEYREIGTVEECRKAVERQKPKEPTVLKQQHSDSYNCPKCGRNLILKCGTDWFGGQHYKSCPNCGQAIRWNENLEGMEDE